MKVAIIAINYKRYELFAKTLFHNMNNAGYPFGLIVVNDVIGCSKATNIGLRKAKDYDAVHCITNDILQPDNWLRHTVEFLEQNPNAGMIAIPINYSVPELTDCMVVGGCLFSRKLIDAVGAADEQLDPYGPGDLDYCDRANRAGFRNYYLPNLMATSVDEKEKDELVYPFDKKESMARGWEIHVKRSQGLDKTLKIEL